MKIKVSQALSRTAWSHPAKHTHVEGLCRLMCHFWNPCSMGAIMLLYSAGAVQLLIKFLINSASKNYWLTSVILNSFPIKSAVLYNVGSNLLHLYWRCLLKPGRAVTKLQESLLSNEWLEPTPEQVQSLQRDYTGPTQRSCRQLCPILQQDIKLKAKFFSSQIVLATAPGVLRKIHSIFHLISSYL